MSLPHDREFITGPTYGKSTPADQSPPPTVTVNYRPDNEKTVAAMMEAALSLAKNLDPLANDHAVIVIVTAGDDGDNIRRIYSQGMELREVIKTLTDSGECLLENLAGESDAV